MAAVKPIKADFSLVFQVKYGLSLIGGSILTTLIYYFSLDRSLGENYLQGLTTINNLERALPFSFLATFLIQLFLILIFSTGIFVFVSHKIAGPVYRFEHFMRKVLAGDLRSDVRIREDDQLQSMVSSLNGFVASMRKVFFRTHSICDEIDRCIDSFSIGERPDLGPLQEKITELRFTLGRFQDRRGT